MAARWAEADAIELLQGFHRLAPPLESFAKLSMSLVRQTGVCLAAVLTAMACAAGAVTASATPRKLSPAPLQAMDSCDGPRTGRRDQPPRSPRSWWIPRTMAAVVVVRSRPTPACIAIRYKVSLRARPQVQTRREIPQKRRTLALRLADRRGACCGQRNTVFTILSPKCMLSGEVPHVRSNLQQLGLIHPDDVFAADGTDEFDRAGHSEAC